MKSNKQVALEIKKDGSVYIQPDNIFVENQMEGHYIVARHHPETAVNDTILCNPGIYPIPDLQWRKEERPGEDSGTDDQGRKVDFEWVAVIK